MVEERLPGHGTCAQWLPGWGSPHQFSERGCASASLDLLTQQQQACELLLHVVTRPMPGVREPTEVTMAMRSQKDGLRRAPESYLLRPIAPSATLTWRPGLPISNLQCETTSSSRSPVVWLSSALAMNGGRRCRAAAACCHSAMPPTPGKGPCRVLAKKKTGRAVCTHPYPPPPAHPSSLPCPAALPPH
jgi:hypothetical protein